MEYILISCLLLSSAFDIRKQKIPNAITFPSIIAFILIHGYYDGFSGILFSISGMAIAFGTMFIPYAIGVMGAGDVKLMMSVGACLGPNGALAAFLFTSIAGGIYALIVMMLHKNALRSFFKRFIAWYAVALGSRRLETFPENNKADMPMLCYGLAITAGTLTTMALYQYHPDLLILNLLGRMS
ncbi:A24 family peptidase [Desulfovibrio mangrovi]|uniref:A24 family peptidase n=1 Tax=Desulfovibrio mangrovi TaxID=2976983 RepID=UPI002246F1EC|nr:A24 family peptidase [Desulfovibrio mangrovi]UZP68789.1 A24 family peptidase [Desulfovibrio mangrovi]